MNVLAAQTIRGRIEYWKLGTDQVERTPEQEFTVGEPVAIRLSGLTGNTAYRYRLTYAAAGAGGSPPGPEYGFHTQRAPGGTFTFQVQGDSHPERRHQNDPTLYAQTLRAAAAHKPDFYIAIGDDFSVDTLRDVTPDAVDRIYLGQRYYLGLVGHSAPLFLVNGNHEQAALCNLDGTPDNVAVWAQNCREKYFSQPAPEGIFTGNAEHVEHIGLLRDYYAWTWGDALFVVIDPYWHSKRPVDNVFGGGKKNRDLWDVTLGDTQYRWLKATLEASNARFKFVFTHHVLGTGRGGVEQAGLYEWGGKNRNGRWEFDVKRPGWELPIHQLMAKTGVTIFFQGHDHLFCKQELDDVVYQTLPLPADSSYTLYNAHAYRSGDALPGSGRVRVTVLPKKVLVEYVRSYLPKDVNAEQMDGAVAYSYTVAPRTTPRSSERP
ncbi:MAG: metallophosphoesterase [Planctomycetes bacterium]|nr:metallophosphoesterase [Planctomycetota bacterium]